MSHAEGSEWYGIAQILDIGRFQPGASDSIDFATCGGVLCGNHFAIAHQHVFTKRRGILLMAVGWRCDRTVDGKRDTAGFNVSGPDPIKNYLIVSGMI